MHAYKNDPAYPVADTSPEALDRAMARGRFLRSRAYHDMAIGFYGTTIRPGLAG
jgi:hypothetical protein